MKILVQDEFKPGDMPPEGNSYLAWHEWAEVQHKAGIKQVECGKCGKWKTPQELSGETVSTRAFNSKGEELELVNSVCKKCSDS